jgi:hypothetical protein
VRGRDHGDEERPTWRGCEDRAARHACPVAGSILEPRNTGEPSRDDALAGALGDESSEGAQGVIVSSLESFPSVCEQRGEDDPTVSGEG